MPIACRSCWGHLKPSFGQVELGSLKKTFYYSDSGHWKAGVRLWWNTSLGFLRCGPFPRAAGIFPEDVANWIKFCFSWYFPQNRNGDGRGQMSSSIRTSSGLTPGESHTWLESLLSCPHLEGSSYHISTQHYPAGYGWAEKPAPSPMGQVRFRKWLCWGLSASSAWGIHRGR